MIEIIDSEFIKNLKSFEKNKSKSNVNAQILKIERLKRQLTLEEAARGVCSVSYLSKLENQIIESGNNEYIRVLCEKYDIPYESLNQMTDIKDVLNALEAYFYSDYGKIKSIYEKMPKITFSSPRALISCLYFLTISDFESFEDDVKNLDAIKFSLTELECLIFVYLLSEYYIKKHNYQKAFEQLKAVSSIYCSEAILYLLMLEAMIVSAFNIGRSVTLINTYHELEKNLFLGYPEEKRTIMHLMYDATICDEFPQDVIDDFIRTKHEN